MASKKRTGVWCVGMVLADGKCPVRVFDDRDEAKRFVQSVVNGTYLGVAVQSAAFWEM